SEIRLSWADNSDNEAEFKIRRSLDGADWNVPEPVLLAPNATEYVNTGLQPGTTYHFILRSQNAAGTLGYTDPVLATTLSEAAAPPSDLRADALSAMEIRLTWTDNSDNELGFKIRRGTAPDEQPDELYVDADTTAYVDGGRAPNTTYYYTVKARDNFGGSAYTPVVAATTPRATAGEFIAYNDLAWAEGQRAANISVLTRGEAGLLVDHATGAPVNVRLAISAGGGGPYTTQGADAAAGTDAGALFGGIVDGTGLISYSTEDLVLSLTGLDPTYQYALTLFGNRAGSSYTARTTVVRLEGAESFVNTSSAGARVETDAAADDTTVIANGSNTGQGLVARYAAILCGSDGAVALRIPGWSGTDEAGRYYVNALMVAATERQIPQDKIAKGGTWRYRKGTAEASAPATRWRETGFDDGGWASGNAPFGYGPLSYATVLDMNRVKYASVFLRKTFSVEDPARVSEIRLAIDYDDGFVAWINGREVARVNVQGAPGTFVACNQTCDGYVSGSAAAWAGSLAGSALPALGAENVLAVQVFNNSLASGDALFDAALSVVRTQLSVTEDGDRDALPDAWEADRLAGLSDPADLSDSGDPDADGVSNLEEYIAGTDPQDESDAFAVEVSLVNGAVVVTFDTVAAGGAGYEGRSRHYALEQCVLNASAWSAVPGYEDILGAGQTVTYTPAADAGPYAYRARVWLE
ncbi:MAG: fibronectin type III domain-containing protein, partial [Kiritimatiellae bacterium]|nr:fibronectin type III domain-containing protein [Kiritimatiellia bacterium]